MLEFQVNEYLTLRLESDITNIYVKNRYFRQCKYLLLNIPVDQISSFDEIKSIDEAVEKLDRSLENDKSLTKRFQITPEEEFWAHCSNLQVWSENNYNTRILHRNLAFPLLKKLSDLGDPIAKEVFKKELIKRYKSDHIATKDFLLEEGFLDYLELDEYLNLMLEPEDFDALIILAEEIKFPIEYLYDCIEIENKKIVELTLKDMNLYEFPKTILMFDSLKTLDLSVNKIKEIPKSIINMGNLKELWLNENQLTSIPNSLSELESLEFLDISYNEFNNIPECVTLLKKKRVKVYI